MRHQVRATYATLSLVHGDVAASNAPAHIATFTQAPLSLELRVLHHGAVHVTLLLKGGDLRLCVISVILPDTQRHSRAVCTPLCSSACDQSCTKEASGQIQLRR
jgi:hypothetical protein